MFKNIDVYNDNIAAIDDNGNKITYKEICQISNEIGEIIKDRCVVFSVCSNSIGSLVGYISFLRNKVVPLMLSDSMDEELFNNLYDIYAPSYLWVSKDIAERFNAYERIYENFGYALIKTPNVPYLINDELALLLTTSGSTGSPKLVRQSYKNLMANTESIIEYLQITDSEKAISTLPMSYTYGLSIVNTHITAGARMLFTEKGVFRKEFWNFLKESGATTFGGVPYTYETLDKYRFYKMELPSLRYMTQAGGRLLPDLHKKFAEYAENNNKKFIVMYGQTEATARMSYLPSEKSLEKYGSIGIAIPRGRFELIDTDDSIIEEAERPGEMVYYGDNVTLGYAECREDLSKGDERNGKLFTGDIAKRDKDGYYYIVGRKKRFLKVFGNRVNLDEIETLLKSNYYGFEFACGGIDDNVTVYVVDNDISDKEIMSKNIREFLSDKTNLSMSAFKVSYINEIPKNEAGKILYSNLK